MLAASFDELRACGLSRQKQGYLRSLCELVDAGKLDLASLPTDDEEAVAQLTRIKGIGRWSAEIYLLFAEGRPDIWPAGDLAVQAGLHKLLGLAERPSEKRTRELAEELAAAPRRGGDLHLALLQQSGALTGRSTAPAANLSKSLILFLQPIEGIRINLPGRFQLLWIEELDMKKVLKTAIAAISLAALAPAPASAAISITDLGGTLGFMNFMVAGNVITINETWTSGAASTLLLSGLDPGVTYTVIKNITNNSGLTFTSLANELLDPLGDGDDGSDPLPYPGFVPAGFSTSNDGDGLSFAQGSGGLRISSAFSTVTADELTDARDFLDFSNGSVGNGFFFNAQFDLVNSLSNAPAFVLSQRVNTFSTSVPEPGSWLLMVTGFGLLGAALRRRRKVLGIAARL